MINGGSEDNHKSNPTKSDFGRFKSQKRIEPYILKILTLKTENPIEDQGARES